MRISAIAIGLVAANLIGITAASACILTSHVAADADMLAMVQQFAFVAEGRIGDGSGAATFELDLGPDTGAPWTTAQYAWPNGTPVPFSLIYDQGADLVHFTVGATALSYTPAVGFAELFVRTRAVNAGSSILVDNLALDGVPLCDSAQAVADGLDILRVQNQPLQNGFTLTGQVTMSWTGTMPTQSRLAFQLKVATPVPVASEPATWGRVKATYR